MAGDKYAIASGDWQSLGGARFAVGKGTSDLCRVDLTAGSGRGVRSAYCRCQAMPYNTRFDPTMGWIKTRQDGAKAEIKWRWRKCAREKKGGGTVY